MKPREIQRFFKKIYIKHIFYALIMELQPGMHVQWVRNSANFITTSLMQFRDSMQKNNCFAVQGLHVSIASQINESIPHINRFADFLVVTWDLLNFANREGIFDDFWHNVGGVPQNCPQLLVDAFNELLNAVESSRADAIAEQQSRAQKMAKTQRQKARETQFKSDTDPDTNPDPDTDLNPDTDTFNGGEAAILNW